MSKKIFYTLIILTASIIGLSCNSQKSFPKYKDATLPISVRVDDLISRMTLEEKAMQMVSINEEVKNLITLNTDGSFNLDSVKAILALGVGQIPRISETIGGVSQTSDDARMPLTPYQNAALSNQLQKFFIEETRLGIPAIFHEECLHGLAAYKATSFPQPIALGGTFNPDLIQDIYTLVAKETRLRGAHQALTPVLDIARDPRWGRVEETYGEDTYLVTEMGLAAIKGFQGDNSFSTKDRVAATLKHFAAHGEPSGGMNTGPVSISERLLREIHLYPFKRVIQETDVKSIMSSYHEIDGVPGTASKWLLDDILRKEWGFKGFVVSDYFSIRELHDRWGITPHAVARDGKHAAELAIKAGVNIEFPNPDCYNHVAELVTEGTIDEAKIDELVKQMLTVKFELGLFDDPYVDPQAAEDFSGIEENRQLALQSALQSITLVQNKANIAPLNINENAKIAVIGPNADRILLGGYSGTPAFNTTVLEGIRNAVGNKENILFAQGTRNTIGGSWVQDEVVLPNKDEEKALIREAVKTAKNSDVIVLALGGNEQTSREAWNVHHLGDRADLDLFGMQNELINALAETGKPIVAFVFGGRPLAYNNLLEKADAVFQCWYLGQETGVAVAKVLFGEYNPGGKLPISFPRSAGHIPSYYNHKPTARRGYLHNDVSPLLPFGFGLSYTTFEISDLKTDQANYSSNEEITVSVQVTNTGSIAGDEVVQLYINQPIRSVTRPVKELKDFKRIHLEAGETRTVKLTLDKEKLSFYDINMNWTTEAGPLNIMVGNSSRDQDLLKTQVTLE